MWWKYLIIYIASLMGIYLFNSRGGGLHHINDNSQKGFFVERRWLQRLLRIEKGKKFISYLSLIFVLLGYVYILAIIPCVVIMAFVSIGVAKWIAIGHFCAVVITDLVLMGISLSLDTKKREKWI